MTDIKDIRERDEAGIKGMHLLDRDRAAYQALWDRRHLLRMVDALCARGSCPCPPKKACIESVAVEYSDAGISDEECFRCVESWANEQAKEVRQ